MLNSTERHEARYRRRKYKRDLKKRQNVEGYDDFDKVFSFKNLYDGYKNCIKGVQWKASTQIYKSNALINIADSRSKLLDGSYKSMGFYEFDIFERGKHRHIRSVHISERCIQRTLCDKCLIPVVSRRFVYDNSANIKGRGYDFAINRATAHLHKFYRSNGHCNNGYVLMIDFSKFFDRIQHDKLFSIIDNEFSDKRITDLYKLFISAFGECGLGLGSQVSQISALLYPNHIDHFIKDVLRIKFFGRYMDDMYLIHNDKEYLKQCLLLIKEWCSKVGIVLNDKKTTIVKLSNGFKFLKIRFTLTASGKVVKRLCRQNITRMRRKLKKYKKFVQNGRMSIDDVYTSFVSWRGHAKRCNSYKTIQSMSALYDELFGGITCL